MVEEDAHESHSHMSQMSFYYYWNWIWRNFMGFGCMRISILGSTVYMITHALLHGLVFDATSSIPCYTLQ